MTNYTWLVTTLWTQTIDGEQNYVVIASYDVTGVDGTYTASLGNTAQFSTSSVSPFIPYEDLTNDIVDGLNKNWGKMVLSLLKRVFKGKLILKRIPPYRLK